jgi:hemerythrin-like domain-containing protein
MDTVSRRRFMANAGILGIGFLINGCSKKEESTEVSATEDLMREHGVLRRALFVYSEASVRLHSDPSSFPADVLQKTAQLFRAFGEDYHERSLEEAYIFPAVKKAGGEVAGLTNILINQHRRGRDITDYILSVTNDRNLDVKDAAMLASTLESFVRMYRPHASREDTIIFPTWKQMLSAEELEEMNERFEHIEHQQFGEDGFEKTVQQISEIEAEFYLSDLAQFTAAKP